MIPPRPIYTGDAIAGKALRGFGNKVLAQLRRSAEFQTLDTHKSPKIRFADGSIVQCTLDHGLAEIHIFRPHPGDKEKIGHRECLCNCGFSVGQVLTVKQQTVDDAPLYDVIACNGRGKDSVYMFYENILASDYTLFVEDDVVLLIPYNENLYTCCTTETLPMGCSPIESEEDIASAAWRSTYRIIPWKTDHLPMWRYYDV